MDAFLHRWLRPTRRVRRVVASLVVVALLGWLSLAAGHVHLERFAAAAHAAAPEVHGPGDHGDSGDRSHACSVCAALERVAGPADVPAFVVLAAPERERLARAPDPVPVAYAAAPYRSRAPPHA